jgi:hypothetical protein
VPELFEQFFSLPFHFQLSTFFSSSIISLFVAIIFSYLPLLTYATPTLALQNEPTPAKMQQLPLYFFPIYA